MAAKIITVFSNKGGVGKTFVCVNTATALALAGKKVLLVDLDFQAGQDMARMLNLAPQQSIVDLLPEIDKINNPETLRSYVMRHASGLDFITSVTNTRQIGHISPDNIKPFFKYVIPQYDFIIVDVSKAFSEVLVSVLDISNLILLVATPDILAVYQIKWGLEVLQAQHFPLKMMRMVLNRAESHGGVSWQEVKAALGCEILSRIPSDGKVVGNALNRGIPCVMDSPRARVATAFSELAETLITGNNIYIETTEIVRVRTTTPEQKKAENFWEKFGISEGMSYAPKFAAPREEDEIGHLKKRIHEKLIERMNLKTMTPEALADPEQAARIKKEAERLIVDLMTEEAGAIVSSHHERAKIVKDILNEALGLGPLEELLADPDVTDIMVNNKDEVYIEKNGKIVLTGRKFISNQQVRTTIERIIAPLGRRIDESVPMVDARLPDGSRINAIIPPLSLRGPMITIRKFAQDRYTVEDLLTRFHSMSQPMADFLNAAVVTRKNMLVSGGTGSGKTTLLNIVSHYIPDGERIITIEDAAELKLNKSHWARLECRPSNIEGKGGIGIRDLFVNTLRMRPDRIIIGECRGGEVLDMLQAMNTGHDGSLTTIHANSTRDAVTRMNSLILLSGLELPLRAVYEMIASAIDIIVHVSRMSDGTRKIIQISEITGRIIDGIPEIKDIFVFKHKGLDENGRVLGEYVPTGYVPECLEEINRRGMNLQAEMFSPDKSIPANP
ncbi:MAG: Flp pilus assembly complex ATPase component TadA [Candidatus Omnitrophica bacterium]|nr:Flp pilus assembly complex ATPase component TadA [Candidatus Omnitrophota bacterium]